jgi:hypothetical protein
MNDDDFAYFSSADPLDLMRAAMKRLDIEDPMTVAHTLKGGIEALETRGWCQRTLIDGRRVCAVGALVVTAYPEFSQSEATTKRTLMDDPVVGPGVLALAATLGWAYQPYPWEPTYSWSADEFVTRAQHDEEQWHSAFVHVTSWNDAATQKGDVIVSARTIEDVKDLFRRAISLLEVL